MVAQGGLAGSSSIAARQERRACRANEHYGPSDFLQAPRVAVRGFESLKRSISGLNCSVPILRPETSLERPENRYRLRSPDLCLR